MDTENEKSQSSKLKGKRMNIIVPNNIFDIWSQVKVLLVTKLSGHTNTLPEASSLIDDLEKRVKYKTNKNIEMLLINIKLDFFRF